ncbi:oxidoreductase [Cohnella sp. WQ 127256]|uniref:oxidoreductase n=1 Tax=Cohnella sp. WQ 127256 TaxID=2938790 RepID=UPI0021187980|nr:oxidoreductase [Cohnella sp. WQ 127256]
MDVAKRKALIVGGTGLIGNQLLQLLLQSEAYESVIVLIRKPLAINHPKLIQKVVDFDDLDNGEQMFGVDDVFCCLGTTIKKAGSKEAFLKVDFDYPLQVAQLAKENGATQFLIVTAMGADRHSRVFYSRVKGEIEEALKRVKFPSLHIFHPSLLLGKRNEFRFGEKVAEIISPILSPLLRGKLSKYKPIQAKDVAQAMVRIATDNRKGEFVYEWKQMMSDGSVK